MDNNDKTTNLNESNGFNQGTQQAPYGDNQYSQNQQSQYNNTQYNGAQYNQGQNQQAYNQQQYGQQNFNQPYQAPVYQPNIEDQSVLSVGQWMVTMLLLALPCVGLIMAFVWAFGQGNVHRKNFCRAHLIWMAIALAIYLVLVIILVAMGLSMSDVLYDALRSNSYSYY